MSHRDRLLGIGNWLKIYGETIYGTRKGFMRPAAWGVTVEKGDRVYLHIMHPEKINKQLILTGFPYKILKAYRFESGQLVR